MAKLSKSLEILGLIIALGMLIVAILQWKSNYDDAKALKSELVKLQTRVEYLNEKIEEGDQNNKKLYDESLRKYISE